jgi:phage FluMu protein Com
MNCIKCNYTLFDKEFVCPKCLTPNYQKYSNEKEGDKNDSRKFQKKFKWTHFWNRFN